MKKVIPFDLDGSPVYIEVDDVEEEIDGEQLVTRENEENEKNRFANTVAKIGSSVEFVGDRRFR